MGTIKNNKHQFTQYSAVIKSYIRLNITHISEHMVHSKNIYKNIIKQLNMFLINKLLFINFLINNYVVIITFFFYLNL